MKDPNASETEILITEGAADFLKTSPAAIRNKVLRGQIPYRKRAGRLYFLKNELKAWVDRGPGLRLEDLE